METEQMSYTDEKIGCGTYTQWNNTQQWSRMKLCCFHVHGFNGSEGQMLTVFPHMWKLDLKGKFIQKCIYYLIDTQTQGERDIMWL
jgi:hypothetical protein